MGYTIPKKGYFILFLLLVGVAVFLFHTILATPAVAVETLTVGQGNATLVRTKDGTTILIDTGPDASILRALGTKLPPWHRTIDLVILTSATRGSVGGLPDVLRRYTVLRQLPLTADYRLTFDADNFIDITLNKNAPAGISVSGVVAAKETK